MAAEKAQVAKQYRVANIAANAEGETRLYKAVRNTASGDGLGRGTWR